MVSLVDYFKVDNPAPLMKVVEKPAVSVSILETTATKSPVSGQPLAPPKSYKMPVANQATAPDHNDEWEEF